MNRIALLLGMPYPHLASNEQIACVPDDLEAIARSLQSSRYQTKILGVSPQDTKSTIKQMLKSEFQQIASKDVLVLYVTGHGYATPNGFVLLGPEYRHPHYDTLPETGIYQEDLELWISQWCPASLVIVAADACRSSVRFERAEASYIKRGTDTKERVCWVFSCAETEESRYAPTPPHVSHFTKALSAVIANSHPTRSIGAAVTPVQKLLESITDTHYGAANFRQNAAFHLTPTYGNPRRNKVTWIIFDAPGSEASEQVIGTEKPDSNAPPAEWVRTVYIAEDGSILGESTAPLEYNPRRQRRKLAWLWNVILRRS